MFNALHAQHISVLAILTQLRHWFYPVFNFHPL